jgi:hypothetical protein
MPRMHRPPRAQPLRELAPWAAPRPQTMLAVIAAATLVAALVAAGAGWWIRSAAGPDAPRVAPVAVPVTVGPVVLVPPARWTAVDASAGLPATDPSTTAAFELEPGVPGRAIVTLAPADDPSLLPKALRDIARGPLPAPQKTTLLGHEAWSYPSLNATGRRTADVTVLATSAGVLAVACLSDSADANGAAGCASQIAGLRLSSGEWLRPSADLAAAAVAPPILRRLDSARLDARAALHRARTPRGQAHAARRLSAVHARAAGSLAPYADGRAGPVVAALRASSRSYAQLAAAAGARAPQRYRTARGAVRRDDAALRATVGRFTAAP